MKPEIMEKYFILVDDGKYYVAEGQATYNIENALKIKSIKELIATIPIMKDWNWDYKLHLVENGKTSKIEDKEWMRQYDQWKKENPKDYEKLYSSSGFNNFIRTTAFK